ncbi:hypothetical protein GP486_003388 [Trichoglossum hirsutum]|uniref:Uncharacterized protein n=1 Tax=Trichoglossum hirsutum TaxID=265104 RepID=A0A9P8LD76_9PEZI|nr:hypothetical protein GP486_003388 [Trichoglossum hirsutum]
MAHQRGFQKSSDIEIYKKVMGQVDLPPFLAGSWQFYQYNMPSEFQDFIQKSQWTVSELAESQINHHIEAHKRYLVEQERSYRAHGRDSISTGAASLLSSCAARLIELLQSSDNFLLDVETVAKNLNSPTLLTILRDPRLPYPALRAFMNLPANHGPANAAETARANIDVDEAILANEAYVRSRGAERNKDKVGLIRLSDAEVIFGASSMEVDGDGQELARLIVRKDPPKGGFEFFDAKRPRSLRLQPSTEAFISTFNRITRGILQNLNWNNVFIAGGMVLTTLLHVDPAKDDDVTVKDCDIDLYVYGLTPSEANEKVKEIYDVWASNLPPGNRQRLVVKNARTITFLSDYPNRRIQVVLKSLASPTAVLLNFDLDPCALGFDGTDVLMLPRCARALETGYSTFTMDLIWGHHLGDRRSTQDARVFKYADRGFGVRILPSYIKSFEVDLHKRIKYQSDLRPTKAKRRFEKDEPGLKTLKRIVYLAQDMVHRFYYGITDLSEKADWMTDEEWDGMLREHEETLEARLEEIPTIHIGSLDSVGMHIGLPGGRQGVGGFEIWMRHHEAWKLDAMGKARLDLTSLSSTVYDEEIYDDLPGYRWDASFDAAAFAETIDSYNDELFIWLREVHGPDIESVFEKQITIPIEVPFKLEDYISTLASPVLEEADIYNGNENERCLLIPVHELARGTSIIPDLVDSDSATDGNLRYWVIGNDLMWALGENPPSTNGEPDRIFETLWSIFRWCQLSDGSDDSLYTLALAFRRRNPHVLDLGPLPAVSETGGERGGGASGSSPSSHADTNTGTPATATETATETETPHMLIEPTARKTMGVLGEYEARLFQQWAFHVPESVYRHYQDVYNGNYDEDRFLYPFPDELFWKDGDEGTGEIEWVVPVAAEEGNGADADTGAGAGAGGVKRKRESTGTTDSTTSSGV